MSTIAELDAEYAHLMDRYFQLEENGTPEERRKVMKEIDRFSFRYADLAALQNAGLGSGSASGASAGPVDAPLTPMKRRASQQAEVSPFLPGESGRNIKYRNDGYFYDYDGDGDIGGRRLAMEWATPPATWSPERHQRTNQQISK